MNKEELKKKVRSLFGGNIEYFDSLYARIDLEKSTKNSIMVEIVPPLYKGIFWIIDPDNPHSSSNYCFKILSDTSGNSLHLNLNLNAKSGTTYNHKIVWQKLSRKETFGKSYNYFPRGRVEIHNGVAKIFLNGNINTAEVLDFLVDEFNLNSHNGIKDIKIIEDNSYYYLCYLDDGWKEDK